MSDRETHQPEPARGSSNDHEARAYADFFGTQVDSGTTAKYKCEHDRRQSAVLCWECGPKAVAAALKEADNKATLYWQERMLNRLSELHVDLDRAKAEADALREWRNTVTCNLQHPGGAKFEDVPQLVKDMVEENIRLSHEGLQVEKQSAEAERDYFESEVLALRQRVNELAITCNQLDQENAHLRELHEDGERQRQAARVEGLREAMKEICGYCAKDIPMDERTKNMTQPMHLYRGTWQRCSAERIRTRIAALASPTDNADTREQQRLERGKGDG